MSQASKIGLLGGLALTIAVLSFALVPPIAQPSAYHGFSDTRGAWGLVNFADVMSSMAFLPVGLYGLWVVVKGHHEKAWFEGAHLALGVFYVGVVLVGPGSAYYHLAPDNGTLFWDRLPITIAFMGLMAAVIADRIDAGFGARVALPLLVCLGLASAVYWRITDDLRAYGLVQFLPVLIIPLIMLWWPRRGWIGWPGILGAFVFYALAKVTEYFDAEVFALLGGVLSGHTIKHVLAALGPLVLAWSLRRQSLSASS